MRSNVYSPINDIIVVETVSRSSDIITSKLVEGTGGLVLIFVRISIIDGVVCGVVAFSPTFCGTTIGVTLRIPAK